MSQEESLTNRANPLDPSGGTQVALMRLRGADMDPAAIGTDLPLETGDKIESLERLDEFHRPMQDIRERTVRCFGDSVRGVFLTGRAALVELGQLDEEVCDLDLLIVGLIEQDLLDQRYLDILREEYRVEVVRRTDIIYLKIYDKTTGDYLADIDVPYRPKSSTDVFSAVFALQRMATAIVAIEILPDGYRSVSAYEGALDAIGENWTAIALPFAPGLNEARTRFASSMLRYQREVARTPFLAATLVGLNAIRAWWLSFRNTEHTLEEVRIISDSAERVLRQGFADANRHGMGEMFFMLLAHTGSLHALFPYSWQCASHRLFGPKGDPDGCMLEFMKREGFSLDTLNAAIARFIDPTAYENILGRMKESQVSLPGNWYTSFLYNCLIEYNLVTRLFPLRVFIHGSLDSIAVHELLGARRPIPLVKNDEQEARYLYWNIVGPYMESYVLAEVLRLEALLGQASIISGVEKKTSTFDRVGIIYQRVQTHVVRLIARGRFVRECRAALEFNRGIAGDEMETEMAWLRQIGVRVLTEGEMERIARFSIMFKQHLARFHSGLMHGLSIDEFTQRVILNMFEVMLPRYHFVFD
ncbi:hypothetical protein JW766_00265 [Candidatus Dojkabacteria bacterium]|nr:hypothetical protein [Candidatus Dojkabacteria bacterium]